LGDGWSVIATRSFGKHNLVGFDSKAAKKKGLDMVDADTLTTSADGQPLILRVHYGVHNPGSNTTLISDVQLRHAGAIVDACPHDKVAHPDGSLGTQSLYFPKDEDPAEYWQVPLCQMAGLMTFSHRAPVLEDYDQDYPIVHITIDSPWDPREHYDDNGNLQLPEPHPDVLAQLVQQVPAMPPDPAVRLPAAIPHTWHDAETYSVRTDPVLDSTLPVVPDGTIEDLDDAHAARFSDALDDLPAKLVFGKAFHLSLGGLTDFLPMADPVNHRICFL
jgi:hypothetical protein